MTPTVIVALVAAVIGPLVAYMTAARKLSGRVGTSEASQLWAESKVLRDDYRERLTATDLRQAQLEARVSMLEGLNNELARDNLRLTFEGQKAEQTIGELRARVDALERENAALREHVDSLEERTPDGS